MSSLLNGSLAREEEVRRAEELAELDRAKSSLFSSASHELRRSAQVDAKYVVDEIKGTPLTLIGGPLNDCIAEIKDVHIKAKLLTASRNVDRLARLVDSLMDFSRLEAGRLEGRYSPVQFGPYVADLAAVFRPVIEKAQLTYTITYDTNETRALFIDLDYMEKIIFNLIGNAFKYTLAGSISVDVVYTDTHAKLIVKDTGVGIPAADLPKIWERFHRVEATSRSHEGTGIGLALTKQFIHLHGGDVTVTSKVCTDDGNDHGSTFTASFPLGKEHLPATRLVNEVLESKKPNYARTIVAEAARWRLTGDAMTPSDSEDSYTSFDGTRTSEFAFDATDLVLLVDDNQDMLEYIRNIFSRFCHVRTACNGAVALESARKYRPDLIISDVMMPVLDGFGLVNALKDDALIRNIPIILLSARAGDTNRAEGILSGADDYIPKPFSSRELLARAHFQLQLGKRKREMERRFQEQTKEVQILTDLSPAGLFRINNDGKMLLCNDRFREMAKMPPNVEENWINYVHEDYRKTVQSSLMEALRKHEDAQIDFVFSNGNWVKSYVRWWVNGLVGIVTDMSLTRLYEESLKKRAEEAEERRKEAEERRRGQELLVDVTSHELRQPVSAVINCANVVFTNLTKLRKALKEALQKDSGFQVTNQLLAQIDEDLESLNAIELCGLAQGHIVNDILTLSRMQLQLLTLQESTFQFVQEVRQTCSILFNEMKSKGISYTLNFGPSIQRLGIDYVSADKVRFGQVIINLLSNAIRFSQLSTKKAIEINVNVSRGRPDDASCKPPKNYPGDEVRIGPGERISLYVYVSVRDSGPGLKPKDLEILFQRFQRGTNSEEIFGGSGLGLFVSRKICDLLHGQIEVDANSVEEKGSTFRFFVEMHTEPAPKPSTPQHPHIDRGSSTKLRILVAEDNQTNRTILGRQLKMNGCVPSLAVNGAEAVDLVIKAGEEPFDCILMDCEMPVMSGLEASRELRRLENAGRIPRQRIIALTGNARREQLNSALEAGMNEVMTKPYRIQELLERIRNSNA
ncbi:related to sensory transduction histidine kinase [Serendipita indica DSM 11827]|uniref:Related to sensory transduction histidine kinase n=1 Tax=Serendipita indica (strain DSM 11827) TaxID=1109443 RepID=G4TPW1_SERID|nr:related to sensory transduction histidine kinase [Serendipita indica DSM 11827]